MTIRLRNTSYISSVRLGHCNKCTQVCYMMRMVCIRLPCITIVFVGILIIMTFCLTTEIVWLLRIMLRCHSDGCQAGPARVTCLATAQCLTVAQHLAKHTMHQVTSWRRTKRADTVWAIMRTAATASVDVAWRHCARTIVACRRCSITVITRSWSITTLEQRPHPRLTWFD